MGPNQLTQLFRDRIRLWSMESEENPIRRARAWLLQSASLAFAAYLVALPLIIFVVFPFVGEANTLSAFMLYVPRSLWLILAMVAVVLLWLLGRRRMSVVGAILAIVTVIPAMGLRFNGSAEPVEGRPQLRVASYNRGQHMNQSLLPFLRSTEPDVVLLQDAARRAKNYLGAEGYTDFPHIEGLGEFLILSRYAIVERELISPPHDLPGDRRKKRKKNRPNQHEGPRPIAARFVVDVPDAGRIAVYNVHTLTVRSKMGSYLRGRCLLGVIGLPGTPLAEKRRAEELYWRLRQEQIDALGERIASDSLPCVIAGDFNVPVGGRAYRSLCQRWREAHREVGMGAGYSFPGKTRNPLSLGGPWMRLDHIFFGEKWRALESVTESSRESQHRAVFAVLELVTPQGAVVADSGN